MIPLTLILVVDDLDSYGQQYGLGSQHTPRMNLRVGDAVRHELWVTPSCSSTRASLWSRSYPSRHGIGSIITPGSQAELHPGLAAIPGDHPAYFGKHHLCGQDRIEEHPHEMGWVYFDGHANNLGAGLSGGYWSWLRTRQGSTGLCEQYAPDAMLEAVGRCVGNNEADLCAYGTALIHRPWHQSPGFEVIGDDPASMLRRLDSDLDWLIGLAKQAGWRVLLFSDNGLAGPLGGAKGTLSNRGIQTELWTWGFDVRPTRLDVVDVLSMVDGSPGPDSLPIGSRAHHYSELIQGHHLPGAPIDPDLWSWAIERDRWKLIRYAPAHQDLGDGSTYHLYDLRHDPDELENVADANAGLVVELAHLAERVQRRR